MYLGYARVLAADQHTEPPHVLALRNMSGAVGIVDHGVLDTVADRPAINQLLNCHQADCAIDESILDRQRKKLVLAALESETLYSFPKENHTNQVLASNFKVSRSHKLSYCQARELKPDG